MNEIIAVSCRELKDNHSGIKLGKGLDNMY